MRINGRFIVIFVENGCQFNWYFANLTDIRQFNRYFTAGAFSFINYILNDGNNKCHWKEQARQSNSFIIFIWHALNSGILEINELMSYSNFAIIASLKQETSAELTSLVKSESLCNSELITFRMTSFIWDIYHPRKIVMNPKVLLQVS